MWWRGKYLWADLPFPYCANLYHDCFSSLSSSWVRNISRWIENMLAAIPVFLIYIPVHYTLKPNPRVCCSGIWWTSGLFSRTFLLFLRFPEIHIPQQLQSLALPALYGDRLRAWQGSFTWTPLLDVSGVQDDAAETQRKSRQIQFTKFWIGRGVANALLFRIVLITSLSLRRSVWTDFRDYQPTYWTLFASFSY